MSADPAVRADPTAERAALRLHLALKKAGARTQVRAENSRRTCGVRIEALTGAAPKRLLHALPEANCLSVCGESPSSDAVALERLAGVLENAIRDAIGNGILLAPKFPCRDCKTPSGIHVRRLVQPVVSDRLADVIERGIHTRLLHGGRIRPPYCDFEFP